MIRERSSGRELPTRVLPASGNDLRSLEGPWRLPWPNIQNGQVFKLVADEAPEAVLGLIALSPGMGFVEVVNLEVTPSCVGSGKLYEGVAGNLLAFAARLSLSLGYEGFLRLIAKTRLIEHYRKTYGFVQQGRSHVMILDKDGAAALLDTYEGGDD